MADSKPRRPKRALRALLLGLAFAGLAAGGALLYAGLHLAQVAKWALERAFPGAVVEIKSLTITSPSRLEVESLVLTSRRDRQTLLRLTSGSISFEFDDLRNRRLGEIRLIEPALWVTPRIAEAFGVSSGPAQTKAGAPWGVRRLICDYGELHVSGYGNDLSIHSKFSFNFTDFAPSAAALQEHEIVLWDVTAATGAAEPFLRLDVVRAGFVFQELFKRQKLARLSVAGGALVVGDSLRSLFPATEAGNTAPATPPESRWTVRALDIERVTVRLDDPRPNISDIGFALNIHLHNIPLTQTASNLGWEKQSVEIANLEVLSPLDPFTKVLTLDSLFLGFTLSGLVRHEIDELIILGPTFYVGEDLFWYMDDMQKRLGEGGQEGPGWTIRSLKVEYGKITLGSGGRKQYGLPLNFRTSAENVSLDNLAALRFQASLEIPPQRYVFESYRLEFTSEAGELRFAYPPDQNNLVGKVLLKEIRWRQYHATDAWISATFDQKGINGAFGGKVYRGLAGGGFSFFFDSQSPWIGWLSGTAIDLRQLTNVISPKNFQMTGPLDFRLQMDAQGKDIDRIVGDLRAAQPGKMVIGKLNDMLAEIPASWNLVKQSSTRLMLETLRDFEYTSGKGEFWFVQSQGIFQLALRGPLGSRTFDVVLHADDSPGGRWKQRSLKPPRAKTP